MKYKVGYMQVKYFSESFKVWQEEALTEKGYSFNPKPHQWKTIHILQHCSYWLTMQNRNKSSAITNAEASISEESSANVEREAANGDWHSVLVKILKRKL